MARLPLLWRRRQVSRHLRGVVASLADLRDQGAGMSGRYLSATERRDLLRLELRLEQLAARIEAEPEPVPEPLPGPSEEAADIAAAWDYLRSRRRIP